ncbi:MAG TPA: hypothetical protein VFL31_00885 [Nitrospiraceae bacterium]|nr:hypothetical protein [Nitrospiraceae bacterium]
MTIRDLAYPDDARKSIDSLLSGLKYDAATAVSGRALKNAPLPDNGPDFSTGIRLGGRAEDEAVRRDAQGLLARLALISMISRVEIHTQNLLLQRRVLEELGSTGKRIVPGRMWSILKRVQQEAKRGPVKLCSELVVTKPSPPLLARMKWLEGVYRVRNCLAHRLGQVQIVDVKPTGKALEDTTDQDTLKVVWLKPIVLINGKEIEEFPHKGGGNLEVSLREYEREWAVGQKIDVTSEDCQAMAISLSMLTTELLRCFETEMNEFLGIKVQPSA